MIDASITPSVSPNNDNDNNAGMVIALVLGVLAFTLIVMFLLFKLPAKYTSPVDDLLIWNPLISASAATIFN
jgi:O-antigen/teichoic acid export membrane protein